MSRPTLDDDSGRFIEKLEEAGGSSSNPSLRAVLTWTEARYWRTHAQLADAGRIIRGRGYGGSVSLVPEAIDVEQANDSVEDIIENSATIVRKELDLYNPAKDVIETSWVRERAFDSYLVEITALPGRRNTGGTWTRPDISVLASKAYPYLPNRFFEIVTFEIKSSEAINVTGVFEALSHAQFATLSYVIFNTDGQDFDKQFKDTQRVISLATQHGVGLITTKDISQYPSWDERVRPRRKTPDPEQANLIISTCFSDNSREQVIKWHK